MSTYLVTQSRIKENELLKAVEEYSKKLYSTFDLIFDELRIHNNNAVFTPSKKGLDCGTIKTFNFKLTKEELAGDNNKYIFEHGPNKVTLEEKFPLSGVVCNSEDNYYIVQRGDTLYNIAKMFNRSNERIRQIENDALVKLAWTKRAYGLINDSNDMKNLNKVRSLRYKQGENK